MILKPEHEAAMPILHDNGTPREHLIKHRSLLLDDLYLAYEHMRCMSPNCRDYEPGRLERAEELHKSRQLRLRNLIDEVELEIDWLTYEGVSK